MSDLKPCPFCGSHPYVHTWPAGTVGILCDNDDCGVSVEVEALPRDEAITAWNTRTDAFKAGMLESAKIARELPTYQSNRSHGQNIAQAIIDAAEKL